MTARGKILKHCLLFQIFKILGNHKDIRLKFSSVHSKHYRRIQFFVCIPLILDALFVYNPFLVFLDYFARFGNSTQH